MGHYIVMKNRNSQEGIGLLELMLSLAIIAILLVMATRYFVTTSRSEQISRAATIIGAVQAAASSFKGGNKDYTGLTAEALNSMGLPASADYNAAGKTIAYPWGTNGTVLPGSTEKGTPTYVITFPNVPLWACQSLFQKYNNLGAEVVPTACSGDPSSFVLTSQ